MSDLKQHCCGCGASHRGPRCKSDIHIALENLLDAQDALDLFEKQNPNTTTKQWDDLMNDLDHAWAKAYRVIARKT